MTPAHLIVERSWQQPSRCNTESAVSDLCFPTHLNRMWAEPAPDDRNADRLERSWRLDPNVDDSQILNVLSRQCFSIAHGVAMHKAAHYGDP
jgi:hypothetical protein